MIITALTGFLLYKYGSKETLRLNYFAVALLTAGGVLGAFAGQYASGSPFDAGWPANSSGKSSTSSRPS